MAGLVIDMRGRYGVAGRGTGFHGQMFGEMEYLNHGAGGEGMDDGAGGRLDFRSGFLHFQTRDPRDFLPKRIRGTGEKLSVKLLNLRRTSGTPSQDYLGRRQSPVERDHQGVLTQNHGDGMRRMARPLLLESACHLGDLSGLG